VPAPAEAQHQKAFEIGLVLARVVLGDLIDGGLIHADQAPGEEHVLLVRRCNVGGHLHVIALAPEVHRALLVVVVVNHLLILVPDEIALGGAKVGRCLVHGVQGRFQALRLQPSRRATQSPS